MVADECPACYQDIVPGSTSQCPGCTRLYCSQRCLEDMADSHARHCTKPCRPLTTADTLVSAAVDEDMFPDDPQTNVDYFFTRARTAHDKTQLLGLYIGILKILDVSPTTLHIRLSTDYLIALDCT
ncbi:hypothetical protein B0H11DRAFT_2018241 [Mycena galericulata]|nr:hypothetical protein B0H11DRAFT_2018241 [Mycena galericulata]